MVFPVKKFEKFQYKKSSYVNGLIGELLFKQNGNKVDFFTFRTNKEFNTVLNVIKKYGFGKIDKKEIQEEINSLNNYYMDK